LSIPFTPTGNIAEKSALVIDRTISVIKPLMVISQVISAVLPKTLNFFEQKYRAKIKNGKK
jgi:hypothetical protein